MYQSVPPGLEGLVDLACRDGVDIRPTLLRVLTDLYVQKPSHTVEEEQHYVELAHRLFNTVDATTKAAVAARLMNYGYVPEALAHHLEIRAILPDTHAPEQAAARASAHNTVAARAIELTEIFFSADPQERRLILTQLDAVATQDIGRVTNARDVVRHLESAALRHDSGAFARQVVGSLSLDRKIADRIVEDQSGEPLLLIGRVFDMPAAMLQRVLLFLNPTVGQSVQRVYELAALYEQISRPAAAHLLSVFRLAAPPEHPAYQSVLYQSTLWNDEAITAREASTPHRHVDTDRDFADLPSPFKIGAR